CGLEKKDDKTPSIDVVGESNVKLLTFGTWLKHKLNGGELEQKRRRKEFEKLPKRKRKRLR
ncbi:hypothetical protein HAX54_031990, partial [Datura stramonium]|nr:hypothetical protein [Datura stramonium]